MKEQYKKDFFEFIKNGNSPFHVVENCVKQLKEAGFKELKLNNGWPIHSGGKYYMVHHGSSLFAFTIGKDVYRREGVRIGAAHADFPCLRIKANPQMNEEGYQKLNVEVYGGAILNTWMDRPLSIAGRVALKGEDAFSPKMRYVDFKRPLLTIPNMPIHINREVNKGVELNKQVDMLPICGMDTKKENEDFWLQELAQELQVEKEEILDYELSIYNLDEPQLVGFDQEFISSPRLDNLTSTYTLLQSIFHCQRKRGINLIAIFDHEEIGSRTKQGAGSVLLSYVLEKIYASLGRNRLEYIESVSESMMISLDVSHGLHPNQVKSYDVTNKPLLNGGICIKESSSQSYATDSEAVAIVQQICDMEGIPYQKSVNRSDKTGGSTLGAIAGSMVPIKIVDIGVPLLAMHSSREFMGREDQVAAQRFMDAYFTL